MPIALHSKNTSSRPAVGNIAVYLIPRLSLTVYLIAHGTASDALARIGHKIGVHSSQLKTPYYVNRQGTTSMHSAG